jgi:hypothetical protein
VETILKNAVQSIQIGLEDYRDTDARRLLSAVRNFQAGILLLCKEQLRRLSPTDSDEILLRLKMRPIQKDGTIVMIGDGRKTVDQSQIKQLGIMVDWKPLDRLTEYRNDIERYRFAGGREPLTAAIADSAKIIRELVNDVLRCDPRTLLGQASWNVLLETESVFDAEFSACRESLAPIQWYSPGMAASLDHLDCPACSSTLIAQVDPANTDQSIADFRCRSCGAAHCSEELIEPAIEQIFYADFYIAMTGGGREPVIECANCQAETFVLAEEQCAACGYTDPVYHCGSCGTELGEHDLEGHDGRCVPCFLASEMTEAS